jgi:DNA polymerase I-like protein with 3'-5' exonuclease and polymerase domains/uracil-DNA glycosylase
MGLLFVSGKGGTPAKNTNRVSDDLLHKLGCRACPLHKEEKRLKSPKMPATGSDTPLIYIIGEAPGAEEDREGVQFVGKSGDLLRPKIPRHLRKKIRWNNTINCVAGDTVVSSPGSIRKIFRHKFTGPLITPITRSGRVFSITQNHPVLTLRGWVAANEVVKGDYLVSSTDSDWEVITAGPYEYKCPTHISEIFDSICESGISQRVVGSTIDFHGDGSNSEIDIVSPFPELVNNWQVPTDKEIAQVTLALSAHRFGAVLANSQPFMFVSDFNSSFNEVVSDCSGATVYANSNLINTFSGKISFDEIIDIEVRAYSGHVYNLETDTGWYIANNAIIHNCHPENNRDPDKIEIECCRSRIEQDIERTKPSVIFGMGSFALQWAGKAAGSEMWRGRRFPIQIGSHTCWFYGFYHPSFILHQQKNTWKSDNEVAFDLDLKKAFAEVEAGLPVPVVHTAEQAKSNITCIEGRNNKDIRYLLEFLDYAGNCDVAGVDYETQNLRPYRRDSEILTAAVSVSDETVSFGYRHPQVGWDDHDLRQIDTAWVRFLKAQSIKAVHNLSFELEWTCYFYGNELVRSVPWADTMTQAYVLDERVGEQKFIGPLGLDFLCSQYFGFNLKPLTQGLNKENMRDEPLDKLLPYNGMDAKYHRLLFLEQEQRIIDEDLVSVYNEKLRQVPTAVLTQLIGIPIDRNENVRLQTDYAEKIKTVVEEIQALPEAKRFYQLTGKKLNPGSPPDVIVILRDILKTRIGQEGSGWSTKDSILKQIDEPIIHGIQTYRKLTKIKGTYIDPFSEGSPAVYAGDTLHQNLGTCFTETGRLQSDEPNCQNWPIRSPEGKKARKQVKAKVVASFDYGQIDARIIGCGSRDRNYCKALWENYDIHKHWAEKLAYHHPDFVGGKKNLKDPTIMKAFRNRIKSDWVFASFYGAALRTTAGRFGVDEDVLKPLFEEFWKEFHDVRVWQEELIKQFNEFGFVQLFDGLRRRAPLGRGQIINSGVQGATNRIVMHGMNRLSELGDDRYQARFQIHDDLTFLFDSENDFVDCVPTIIDTMLDGKEFDWFCVPLSVEVKSGPNWAELEEVGTYRSDIRLNWPHRAREFK